MSSRPTLLNAGPPQVDPALAQVGEYTLDAADRQYIDTQIRAIQQHLVDLVLTSVIGTEYEVDAGSASLVISDVVCLSANGTKVTKAVAAALTDAKRALGICLSAAAPGTWVRVATIGVLPSTKTGLGTTAGYVRVNTTTARAERVAALSAGDYPLGVVHASGAMSLQPAEVVSGALSGASVTATDFIAVGTAPFASSGEIRADNAFAWRKRNAADNANVDIVTGSGNDLVYGGGVGNSTEDIGTGSTFKVRVNFNDRVQIDESGTGGRVQVLNGGIIRGGSSLTVNSASGIIVIDSPNTLYLESGGTIHQTVETNGIGLFASAGSFGSGNKVLFVGNASTNPSTNPTAGFIIYGDAGAAKVRGSGGTVTTFGPADPHCPTCGRDYAFEARNDDAGEHVAYCWPCMMQALADAGLDTSKFCIIEKLIDPAVRVGRMQTARARDAARVRAAEEADAEFAARPREQWRARMRARAAAAEARRAAEERAQAALDLAKSAQQEFVAGDEESAGWLLADSAERWIEAAAPDQAAMALALARGVATADMHNELDEIAEKHGLS